MISTLAGTVVKVGLEKALIEVGGFGLEINTTPTTLSQLREGESAHLFTEFVVREEALSLYGFIDEDERDAFRILITIRGVGPKLALATLAVFPAQQLRVVVANRDEAALQRIPGVGKKSAARMLIDIGDKLGPAGTGVSLSTGAGPQAEEVTSALTNLGWPEATARRAVANILDDPNAPEDVPSMLRLALRQLGGNRE